MTTNERAEYEATISRLRFDIIKVRVGLWFWKIIAISTVIAMIIYAVKVGGVGN